MPEPVKKLPSRRRVRQLHVPVLPDEMTDIKLHAAQCGLSVAAYLRNLGLQHQPKSVLDYQAVAELAKVNGDLGRLGGLLKMLLSNDERVKAAGQDLVLPLLGDLLEQIQTTQLRLFDVAKKV